MFRRTSYRPRSVRNVVALFLLLTPMALTSSGCGSHAESAQGGCTDVNLPDLSNSAVRVPVPSQSKSLIIKAGQDILVLITKRCGEEAVAPYISAMPSVAMVVAQRRLPLNERGRNELLVETKMDGRFKILFSEPRKGTCRDGEACPPLAKITSVSVTVESGS